ncbi:MAG TPA: glycosyltransferase family 39 protein [Iamia sp.]|nr:glycosyltransferase family 39 protein [Iamia sp.]
MTTTDIGAPARPAAASAPAPAAGGAPWWRLAAPGLVIGALTAWYRLDHRGLWLDEAYTLGSTHQLRSAVPATSWTMSGYYAVLRVWFLVSESVWWMRTLSVLAALAAIAVLVVVARRLAGDREARLAGVLMALSPLWLTYAQEARSYAFVMLLVGGSWLALDHAVADEDPVHRRRWWLLHTAVAVALPMLHGLTVLQLLPQLGLLAVARADRPTWLRALRGVGLSLLITATLARTASDEVGDWVAPVSIKTVNLFVKRFLSRWPLVCIGLVLVVLLGVAVVVVATRSAPTAIARARALVPVLWGLAPLGLLLILSLARPSLVPRYAVGCVPGLALLMAVAVERLGRARGSAAPALRAAAAVAVAVALVAGHAYLHTRPVDGWTVAARRVAAGLEPGDTILLSRESTSRPPFEAAWRSVEPAADPRLVPADRPLGEVLRFEPDETPGTERWNQARAAGRLWVVGDPSRLELDRLPSLTVDGTAGRPASHREVARWRAPRSTIVVVLLEPV